MPLYEYRCRECDRTFVKLERVTAPATGSCPDCGGEATRLISAPALQFKGSGWYVTDYGKGTGGQAGELRKPKTSTESSDSPGTSKTDSSSSSKSSSDSSGSSSDSSGSSSTTSSPPSGSKDTGSTASAPASSSKVA